MRDSDPSTWPRSGDTRAARVSSPAPSQAYGPAVFMAMPSAIALLAPSGIVLDVNAEWRRLTGDDGGEEIGAPVWRRFAPAERSHLASLIERVREAADAYDARPQIAGTQLRHPDGRRTDVALRMTATRDTGALVIIVQVEPLAGSGGDVQERRPGTGDRPLALTTITRAIASGGSLRQISDTVISAVARATGCSLVGLWCRADRREALVLTDGLGFGAAAHGSLVLDDPRDGLADHALRCRGPVAFGGPTGTVARIPRTLTERGVTSGVAVPIHGSAGSAGLLTVSPPHNQPVEAEDVRFLGIVGDLLTMALQRESVDHLIAGERRRTAEVACELDGVRRRFDLARDVAGIHDWYWVGPEPVTTDRRIDPPPRWSAQICLDGGPQALVDCAPDDEAEQVAQALNAALAGDRDLALVCRLRTSDGPVSVRLRGVIERDRFGAVAHAWGVATVEPDAAAAAPAVPVVVDDDARLAHTTHDLNNLLAAVLGVAEQQIQHGGDRRRLTAIVRAARRARELVAGLRPGYDHDHPLAGPYELSDVVDQLRPLLHGLVGRDVRLVLQLGRGARSSSPSREALEHVLLDLVANSRDALADGGTIVVATDTCARVANGGEPRTPPDGGRWARLRVGDTGAGMSADDQQRVFTPGYSTKHGHDHAGLGLAAVHETVTRAGGVVTIDSSPGRGTVVDIYLPLADQAVPRLQPLRAPALPQASVGRGRVAMVVDDEPTLRDLLPGLLERLGYETVVADDGPAALHLAHEVERLDLVVSDLRMPRMDGLELVREIRQLHEHAAVVLLSGAPPETPVADRRLRVLRKPCEWRELRDAVLSLTTGDDAHDPALQASLPAVGGR